MSRGVVTDIVKRVAQETLDIEDISVTELRLMPYIQYVMMDDQRLNPNKIDGKERDILQHWRERGLMTGGASGLAITREFWDGINAILWHAYVERD